MSVKKGTPGKGGGSRPDSFSYTPVPFGTKNVFNAWLAGPIYWAEEAHEYKPKQEPTKPCVHWLTDGALKCRRCARGEPVRCIGWVPLYREVDSAPVIVIVHETVSDLTSKLTYADFVIVGRVGDKDSVFVKRSESQPVLRTEKESRKRPVDITRDLLVIWAMEDYNLWLRNQRGPRSAEKVSATEIEVESSGTVPLANNRLVAAFDTEAEKSAERAEQAKKNRDFVREVAARSVNGKHRKEGEGS